MTTFRQSAALTSAVAALLLTGCRVGPKYQVPPAMAQAPPVAYKEAPAPNSDAWKVAQPQDAMLHGKWWEIYNDPELNSLEDQLNINNQNIKQFFENFMEARTLIAQARSQLYPTVGTSPGYTRAGTSANTTTTTTTTTGRNQTTNLTTLPLDVSWEPDLWGKVRNTIHEQQYAAQLSAADLENERLTEQANLAITFFEIRGQDALQALYDQTIEADKKALDYAQAQYDTGVGDRISVVEAQNTLQNAQATSTNLGVARAQFEHAIAVLIGTNASGFSIPVRALDAAPPAIPIGLPSQLLERRPDVAAAERSMASANAQIGVAYAAYYPSLTLSATGGLESSSWKHLFDIASRYWSVGPSISETIYDAGLRRATVNQYVFTYNADVASYRQTVLTAFQQVEDYLAATRIQSTQIQQQQQAEQSAKEYLDLEMGRYTTGIDPYVDVVTAQTTLLADQQTLVTLHTNVMTSSVQLIEALGGGWDRTQLPTPEQVSKKLTKDETTIQK
ncbi:MAG TPA: efflux transporter outer membrane subunit [Granulicella sp.]|jgi:NodT family efflux transporter outer membrane factor (OMF) lipoprotein